MESERKAYEREKWKKNNKTMKKKDIKKLREKPKKKFFFNAPLPPSILIRFDLALIVSFQNWHN